MSSPWPRALFGCMLAIAGCGRDDEKVEPAAAPAPPATTATATGSCAELAQALCERTPVKCDAASGLLAHAQLGQAECATAKDELIVTDDLGADMRGRMQVKVIAKLMKTSPVVKPEHVDALMAEAQTKEGSAGAADEPSCPGIATKKGERPPDGGEMWCETAEGTRHGPAMRWNAAGELVRTIEYRHGAIGSVRYERPASGDMPMALFVCPDGETLKEDKSGETDVRYCEKDGEYGIVGFWKAGKLTKINDARPRAGGLAQDRFESYMPQSD